MITYQDGTEVKVGDAVLLEHQRTPGVVTEVISSVSSIDHLMSVSNQRGWRVNGMWQGNQPQFHSDWVGIDGANVVWVYLGGYWSVFRTDLDAFWVFDEAGHLVDVKTRRMTDAL